MRFTIRDLLLLTIITALGTGWWLDRAKLTDANAVLQSKYEQLQSGNNIALANERRIANLRAMEAWGRLDGRATMGPTHDRATGRIRSQSLTPNLLELDVQP